MSAGAVIVAAGSSSRMRGTDKLWADLCGAPLIARTIVAFQACPDVGRVVLVTLPECVSRMEALCARHGFSKVSDVRPGGVTRQESVRLGLEALGSCDVVAVHDGARPLVTPELVSRGIQMARERGSALCAVRAKSTIKRVREDGAVVGTPPREELWEAQTPQVFRYDELLEAHRRAAVEGVECTDDAAVMEAAGHVVWVYEGDYRNLKVTTPEDLSLARALYGGEGCE